jgi:hypothetical protein
LTCAVADTQGVTTSITGNAPRTDAGQQSAITWTAPSGKTAVHDTKIGSDSSFADTLIPDEAGTWSGVARLGSNSTPCTILVEPTVSSRSRPLRDSRLAPSAQLGWKTPTSNV